MVKRYKTNNSPVEYTKLYADKDTYKVKVQLPQVIGHDGKYQSIQNVIGNEEFKAYDSVRNAYNYVNPNILPQQYLQLMDTGFIGYGALSMLIATNGILNAICDTLSTEMWRKGIEFVSDAEDEDIEDRITELELEFERLGVRENFQRANYLTFAFGGSYIFPAVGNINYEDTTDPEMLEELNTELFIDDVKIGKGDLQYLEIIEPMWVVPIRFNTTNPFSQFFYKPEYYSVMGKTTHATRLLKFIYNEAPDILKPTYLFNGVPLMQYCLPYVGDFEKIRRAVTTIVQRYNLNVLKTDVQRAITNPAFANQLKQRINILNSTRDNTGTLAIDMTTEDFVQLSMTLAGLKELESQAAEYMCIVSKSPATKLLGQSPQGFNSTGEHELTTFYDQIQALNEEINRPPLIKVMHMAMLNIWGKIDARISFQFKSLEEMNPKEIAEINQMNANTDVALNSIGTLDGQDSRERLRNDPKSGYNGIAERERENVNAVTEEFDNYAQTNEGNPDTGP